MFGFLKKKKSGDLAELPQENPPQPSQGSSLPALTEPKPSKKLRIRGSRRVLWVFLILISVALIGVAGTYFLMKPALLSSDGTFRKVMPVHVHLPPEMIRFCYDHLPALYEDFWVFDDEIMLLESEIQRIDAIAQAYPEQQKIAEPEKRGWEKTRNTLLSDFVKIEKNIKELYVLYQVNPDQGLARIQETGNEIADTAREALMVSQQQSAPVRVRMPPEPAGILQETLYRFKKKFL